MIESENILENPAQILQVTPADDPALSVWAWSNWLRRIFQSENSSEVSCSCMSVFFSSDVPTDYWLFQVRPVLARGKSWACRSYSCKKVKAPNFSPHPLLYHCVGAWGHFCQNCTQRARWTLSNSALQMEWRWERNTKLLTFCDSWWCPRTFETQNEITHFRAVTLSTVL